MMDFENGHSLHIGFADGKQEPGCRTLPSRTGGDVFKVADPSAGPLQSHVYSVFVT